jgi:hypothetical protein
LNDNWRLASHSSSSLLVREARFVFRMLRCLQLLECLDSPYRTRQSILQTPWGRPRRIPLHRRAPLWQLVLSCLIHATGWANAPRWGEGRPPPATPVYAPKGLGKPPCRGSHHPSSVFHQVQLPLTHRLLSHPSTVKRGPLPNRRGLRIALHCCSKLAGITLPLTPRAKISRWPLWQTPPPGPNQIGHPWP